VVLAAVSFLIFLSNSTKILELLVVTVFSEELIILMPRTVLETFICYFKFLTMRKPLSFEPGIQQCGLGNKFIILPTVLSQGGHEVILRAQIFSLLFSNTSSFSQCFISYVIITVTNKMLIPLQQFRGADSLYHCQN
jgi:hypothetical protein